MSYELSDVIDAQNRALHDRVTAKVPVSLVESSEATGWTSRLGDGVAEISTAPTAYPQACYAHELLHLDIKLRGLRQPYFIDNEDIPELPALVGWLENIFEHVAVYRAFLLLGYPASQFLADSDSEDVTGTLERDIPDLERRFACGDPISRLQLAILTVMLLSPPPVAARWRYEGRLKRLCPPDFFEALERLLVDWSNDSSFDLRFPFARFFKICGLPLVGFSLTGTNDDLIVAGNL